MSMNLKAALPVILSAVAVVSVGGCKKASPTSPDISRPHRRFHPRLCSFPLRLWRLISGRPSATSSNSR